MAKISAALVKQLRDKTGAGMGDCKKALIETEGDVEKAVDVLRAQNIKTSTAARETTEGKLEFLLSEDKKQVALVELGCETDFAARNEGFLKLLATCASEVLANAPANVEAARELPAVAEGIREAAAVTIRENVNLRAAEVRTLEGEGCIASYVHHNGLVGVAIGFNAPEAVTGQEAFQTLAKDLCMHATAHHPPAVAIDRESIPSDAVERERAVALAQIDENPKDAKKPDNIKQKMVDGRLRKFYEENSLLEQKFVRDPSVSVGDMLTKAGKDLGGDVKIAWFVRHKVGA